VKRKQEEGEEENFKLNENKMHIQTTQNFSNDSSFQLIQLSKFPHSILRPPTTTYPSKMLNI